MIVRRFEPAPPDAPILCDIFYRSVREVARAKYDGAQVEAWAPQVPDADHLLNKYAGYVTFIAVNDAGRTVGWIAMSKEGYVDMLFCLPEATRCGVAAELYAAVEREAVALGLTRLTVHASLLARSFFHKQGWTVEHHERIVRDGVNIPRTAMSKSLAVQ